MILILDWRYLKLVIEKQTKCDINLFKAKNYGTVQDNRAIFSRKRIFTEGDKTEN